MTMISSVCIYYGLQPILWGRVLQFALGNLWSLTISITKSNDKESKTFEVDCVSYKMGGRIYLYGKQWKTSVIYISDILQ